jgi:hypothetical protein
VEEGRESRGVGAEAARWQHNVPFVLFCSAWWGKYRWENGFKNGRGRVEEMGERPGEVAPERTGLLEPTMRDGL